MPFIKTGDITTLIYQYNRGDRTVKADPAIIWRKLNQACRNLGEKFEKLMQQWNDSVSREDDTDDEIFRKMEIYADLEPKIEAVAREAFGIPPIDDDGNGGTVAMVISVLNDFLTEREKKSENTEILPSSSPPTDGDHRDSSKESLVSNA